MRRTLLLAALSVFLVSAPMASASIIAWDCASDGDGALDCTASFDTGTLELTMTGNQNWGPGHMLGSFTTDTELDPTVTLFTGIDNDTSFTWTGYQVNISMDKTFTLSNVSVLTPGDWSFTVTQPTQVGSLYIGTIEFSAGTPVAIGDTLEFLYKASFLGSVSFTQEMIPTPEPATLALLGFGGALGLVFHRRTRRRV